MPKVFCAVAGGRIRIDNLGTVTDEIGLEISDELAAELAKDKRLLRIERNPPPAAPAVSDGRKSVDQPKPPPKQPKKPREE